MRATSAGTQLWFLDTLVTLRATSEEGSDGLSVLEHLAPRGESPPLHVHRVEDEIFHVLEGELRIRVGDGERRLAAGGTVVAPKGVPHTYVVESARATWLIVTAHGNFERFVRSVGRPAGYPGLPDPEPPTPGRAEALEAACRAHGIEIVGPPLQRG
jgi:quercetin dioxygenase-like cupin family protein